MAQFVIRAFVAAAAAALVALPALAQQGDQVSPPAAPASAGAAPAAPVRVLQEGDPAPSLEGVTWLKREPVTKFESGHYYVVEMWATWCGPCKRSIPNLTAMQAANKDMVTVIGISCWEREDRGVQPVEAAREFVKKQGDAMDYTVAADGQGAIVRNWMQAAARHSIPTAFIIDGFGNIAWIGNPLSGMEEVLARVMAGGYDARVEAAKAKVVAAAKRVKDEKFARANLLANEGKYAEGLKLIDDLLGLEQDPRVRIAFHRQRLRMLLKTDEAAAYAVARSLMEGELKDNDFGLYTMVESIVRVPELKSADHALELAIATRAVELASPRNALVHEMLGIVRFRAGDADGAIAAAEKSLEVMKNPEADGGAAAVERVKQQLDQYMDAKAAAK